MIALKQNIDSFLFVDKQTETICKYIYENKKSLITLFDNKFDYLIEFDEFNENELY
jgi:hypothetical protein